MYISLSKCHKTEKSVCLSSPLAISTISFSLQKVLGSILLPIVSYDDKSSRPLKGRQVQERLDYTSTRSELGVCEHSVGALSSQCPKLWRGGISKTYKSSICLLKASCLYSPWSCLINKIFKNSRAAAYAPMIHKHHQTLMPSIANVNNIDSYIKHHKWNPYSHWWYTDRHHGRGTMEHSLCEMPFFFLQISMTCLDL